MKCERHHAKSADVALFATANRLSLPKEITLSNSVDKAFLLLGPLAWIYNSGVSNTGTIQNFKYRGTLATDFMVRLSLCLTRTVWIMTYM